MTARTIRARNEALRLYDAKVPRGEICTRLGITPGQLAGILYRADSPGRVKRQRKHVGRRAEPVSYRPRKEAPFIHVVERKPRPSTPSSDDEPEHPPSGLTAGSIRLREIVRARTRAILSAITTETDASEAA